MDVIIGPIRLDFGRQKFNKRYNKGKQNEKTRCQWSDQKIYNKYRQRTLWLVDNRTSNRIFFD